MSESNTHRNEVHLAGVLAKDPVVRTTTTGKAVASITVATTFKGKAEYHRVSAWEDMAEKVRDLPKGAFVKVVGRLQTRSWEDASKVKHYTTEVVAYQLVVPGEEPPPAKGGGRDVAAAILSPTKETVEPNIHGVAITDNDIPF